MSEADRLSDLYDRRLGASGGQIEVPLTPAPEPDRPEPIRGATAPTPNPIAWVNLDTKQAMLDGVPIVLSEDYAQKIRALIAQAIAERIEGSLRDWRDKYDLQ